MNSMFIFRFTGLMVLLSAMAVNVHAQPNEKSRNRTLIIFFDGLRPDYITPELMPNLYTFRQQASYGNAHHSVFPTVTRVNASSYSTGAYPEQHGLMGNTVYFPQVDSSKGLNTGEASEMQRVATATNGHLLTALSLGEVLQANGEKMMVFSSGSSGQALMQNHSLSGGAIINTDMILPFQWKDSVQRMLGEIPKRSKPNIAQHRWITDALLQFGFAKNGPLVSAIWYSDPDGAAHSDGIGSTAAVTALKAVDEQFGRIVKALDSAGTVNTTNILISTDHGFSTHLGKETLADCLIRLGLKASKQSNDVIVSEGAIYVRNRDTAVIRRIVAALQNEPAVGAIFTKAASADRWKGWVEGTLSFAAIHWNHPDRSADILVDAAWSDEKNAAGYAGSSYGRGVAGHGSLSPWDVHIPLIVKGPDFKTGVTDEWPTSNVDLVPTVLYLYKIKQPATMKGRVMHELLRKGKQLKLSPRAEKVETEVQSSKSGYRLVLHQTILGTHRYVDFVKTSR